MERERWQQIDELFDAVMDLPESEREKHLAERCPDDEELKNEVLGLLRAQSTAESFLENSAMGVVAKDLAARQAVGGPVHLLNSIVGTYKIEKLLGAGGMGEVYLAHDSKLDRKVAIKIIPAEFVSDDERLKRFDLEARAISALNHPNIVTIYDVGNVNGINYIATEFVEGKTLRQLTAGGFSLKEILSITIQVCEALSAAHGAGIIHRDIKPENIMVRPDGYVKILDFGLVKLSEAGAENDADLTKTAKGVIIGTPAYMSPEQVTGAAVDQRTDLWSIGVVLYEMLTGKNPFKGENRHTTLRSILSTDPEPVTSVDHSLPGGLDQIIAKALEKDPDLGYQTASDLRADLKRMRREIDSSPSWNSTASLTMKARRRLKRRYIIAAATVVVLTLLGSTAWIYYFRDYVNAAGAPNWAQAKSSQLTNTPGLEGFPSLGPDGKSFVYFGMNGKNTDIFWQRVGGTKSTNLTPDSPANDTMPVFSPDGNLIAFRSEREPAGLYIMEATGENVRRVSDVGHHPSWSPDGKQIAVSDRGASVHTFHSLANSSLLIVDLESGEKRKLDTKGDGIQPSWSPNGKRIAYWYLTEGKPGNIATIPAEGGEPVTVAATESADWNPVWSPDGKYLYFSSDRGGNMNVWRIPIDEQTGQPGGEAEAVPTPSIYSRHVSFSRDGKMMAYSSYDGSSNLQTLPFDPKTGKIVGDINAVTRGDREISSPHLSPNGERYVVRSVERTQEDLVVFNRDGSSPLKLTNDKFLERRPRWSPDGTRIAYQSNRSGKYQIWSLNPDGSDLKQISDVSGEGAISPSWSPDGLQIVFTQIEGKRRFPVVVDAARKWDEQTPKRLRSPSDIAVSFEAHGWSKDGDKIIGVFKDEGERITGVGFYSFATGGFMKVGDFGFSPAWLTDGRRYVASDEENEKIFLGDIVTKKTTELFSATPPGGIQHVDISPDDQMIYFRYFQVESDIWLLDSLQAR